MRFSRVSLILAAASTIIPSVSAWGAVGHEIIATVAQMHLHPSVMPILCDILNYKGNCHLAPVAAWADRIRGLPQYRWTGPLHYIGATDDYPSETCAFPGERGWEGRRNINVLSGIRNTTNTLESYMGLRKAGLTTENDEDAAQVALKFLIHFVGDMHMPLHLTGRDRGGNGIKVSFDSRVTNLHSLWDGLLIAKRIRTIPSNYTRPLPLPDVESQLRGTIYDPYIRRVVWEGITGKYEDELDSWLTCPAEPSVQPLQTHWEQWLSWTFGRRIGSWIVGSHLTDGGLNTDDETLCPYHWATPIHALNCQIVFPKALDEPPYNHVSFSGSTDDHACNSSNQSLEVHWLSRPRKNPYLELDTPEYSGAIENAWIVEKLMSQGGIRLAAVLNWLFADMDDSTPLNRTYIL
ncbi:phospholipase C/P1 nuclease domain-containing protein [Suillus variegatus]|nr:phospholipase C/P1 nuclease domain-containing protein [Suillus variegatus]